MSSVNAKWLTSSQHIPYALRQRVKNDSGATIAKYDLVVASNVAPEGNFLKVVAASNADAASDYAGSRMMIALQQIPDGKRGDVVPWALLTSQNTNSYSAVGDPVYMTTGGDITHTKPTTNNFVRIVGRVIVKSATVGVIMLDPNAETGAGASLIASGTLTHGASNQAKTVDLGAQFANATVVATMKVATGSAATHVAFAAVDANGVVTVTLNAAPGGSDTATTQYFVDGR